MSMEKDTSAMHTDDVPQKKKMLRKPTKQEVKDHFRRFWWVHVLIFCIGVLIVALPLVYVGYPNIAQGIVNGAQINLESQSFYNPTNTTIGLLLSANVTIHSIFHAHLDAWNATLYQKGSSDALFSFTIPAFKSVSGTKINVNQTVDIANLQAFENFTATGLKTQELEVELTGRGGLKLGALPHIYINYHKTVSFPGLDGLQQLVTSNLSLNLSAKTDITGFDTTGNVTINNVSPLSLQLGDTSFDIYVDGTTSIGNATVPDLTLAPGNLTYPILLDTNITNVLSVVQTKYPCGVLPVTVVGTGAVYNGNPIPYWTYAFSQQNITTSVSVVEAFQKAGFGDLLKNGTC